jgi:hypothetical protein
VRSFFRDVVVVAASFACDDVVPDFGSSLSILLGFCDLDFLGVGVDVIVVIEELLCTRILGWKWFCTGLSVVVLYFGWLVLLAALCLA